MNGSKRSFAIFSALFALLLLSSTGTPNARDADLDPLIFAAAQTANRQCINSCRARYRDLPVLEANTIGRVSGRLPGLHPIQLRCWCNWSIVLVRVSEVDREGRPQFSLVLRS
jgi:hypothetical protein